MTHSKDIDPQSTVFLRNGHPVFIRQLDENDTDQSVLLRQAVIDDLNRKNPNGQTFLHTKTWDKTREMLLSTTSITFGAFTKDGKLVAQRAFAIGNSDDIPLLAGMDATMGTLNSDMTHPDYQRNGLSHALLHHILAIAEKRQIRDIIACVDIKSANYPLLESFGFRVMSAYIDPADGGKTLGLFRSPKPDLMAQTKHSSELPLDDFAATCALFQKQPKPVAHQEPVVPPVVPPVPPKKTASQSGILGRMLANPQFS